MSDEQQPIPAPEPQSQQDLHKVLSKYPFAASLLGNENFDKATSHIKAEDLTKLKLQIQTAGLDAIHNFMTGRLVHDIKLGRYLQPHLNQADGQTIMEILTLVGYEIVNEEDRKAMQPRAVAFARMYLRESPEGTEKPQDGRAQNVQELVERALNVGSIIKQEQLSRTTIKASTA
jgi:hypothetical protein